MKYIYPSLLMAAIIVGIFKRKTLVPAYYNTFIYYLLFITIIEIYAIYVRFYLKEKNVLIYNFAMYIELLYFIWFFKKGLKKKLNIQVTQFLIFFLFFFILFDILSTRDLNQFSSFVFSVGTLFLVITIFLFFFEFIKKFDKVNPFRDFSFWAATGILFMYLIEFPYLSNFNYFFDQFRKLTSNQLTILTGVAICLSSLSYIIGFLCQQDQTKY